MTKIMLVDDDESMRLLIEQIVRRDGYDFCCADCGEEGLSMLRSERPDFLILDVMLPDTNGFEICQTIRAEGRKVPIMFLTAKGDIVDKSIGFKAGRGRLPLVKPFQPEELSLRLQAHLRRRERESGGGEGAGGPAAHRGGSYKVGDLEVLFGKYEVRLRGEAVQLSSREFELLELLASDPGAVFTRDQILEHVWGDKAAADPNSITVFVRKIREKIEDDPSKARVPRDRLARRLQAGRPRGLKGSAALGGEPRATWVAWWRGGLARGRGGLARGGVGNDAGAPAWRGAGPETTARLLGAPTGRLDIRTKGGGRMARTIEEGGSTS